VKQRIAVVTFACLLLAATRARAQYYGQSSQQFDVGFGVGTLLAPSTSTNSSGHLVQSMSGGTYIGFSGDYIFWHQIGVQGEVNWRASQGLYFGNQPYRPILYDFNGIYAPNLGKHVQLELLAGIGGLSTRFYTPTFFCNFYTCTNYFSTNHFLGDVGAGIRFYVHGGIFVMPEFRQYFIHNNAEFASGNASRAGVTIGYSFGR